jgi:hypothetical protein
MTVAARLRIGLALGAALVATALAVPVANAGLFDGLGQALAPSCGANGKPFAQFGDNRSYFPLPNGGFESGAAGWNLSGGARVVGENEPWFVGGNGASALALPPGASATSPSTCINLLDPSWRMFARSVGANRELRVQIVFRGLTGNLTGLLNVASFDPGGYSAWQPTQDVASLLALPLLTVSAQVRFTSLASSGVWQVDDIFVDPAVSRIG